jgi:hypothetical protein
VLWFIIFLIGILCAVVAIVALAVYPGTAAIQGFLTCAERSLTNFADGRVISALLYLVAAGLLLCARQ